MNNARPFATLALCGLVLSACEWTRAQDTPTQPLAAGYAITHQVTAPPPRLLGWWTGDGDALDSLGQNNARVHGNVTYVPGMVGQAFHFDGANSYLKVLTSDLNPGVGEGFTLDMWIKADDLAKLQPVAGWAGAETSGVSLWLEPATGGGKARFGADLRDTKGGSHRLLSEQPIIAAGEWHHILLEYRRATGIVSLFCDGAMQAAKNVGSLDAQTSLDFSLGKHLSINGGNTTFKGSLDEVSLTARPLDPAEVQSIFRSGSAGKQLLDDQDVTLTQEQRRIAVDKRLASFRARHGGQAATFAIYVDGSDFVHLRGDKVWLVHEGWQLPGGTAPNLRPTRLNGVEWIPDWDDKTSDAATLAVPLPQTGTPALSIDILNNGDIPARSDAPVNVRITQEPTAANGYETVLYLDDLNVPGAHWFVFSLAWDGKSENTPQHER